MVGKLTFFPSAAGGKGGDLGKFKSSDKFSPHELVGVGGTTC
jgi:hypothetical protein